MLWPDDTVFGDEPSDHVIIMFPELVVTLKFVNVVLPVVVNDQKPPSSDTCAIAARLKSSRFISIENANCKEFICNI